MRIVDRPDGVDHEPRSEISGSGDHRAANWAPANAATLRQDAWPTPSVNRSVASLPGGHYGSPEETLVPLRTTASGGYRMRSKISVGLLIVLGSFLLYCGQDAMHTMMTDGG